MGLSLQSLPLLQRGAETWAVLLSLCLCIVVRTRSRRAVPSQFLLAGFFRFSVRHVVKVHALLLSSWRFHADLGQLLEIGRRKVMRGQRLPRKMCLKVLPKTGPTLFLDLETSKGTPVDT